MTELADVPELVLATVANEASSIRDELDRLLSDSKTEAVRACAAYLPELGDDEVVTFVFVGQHDAGKSSLLRCLTSRDDIAVGAGPTTNRTAVYDWSGHRLVDTPGVRAGADEAHDRIADEALRIADVVVFVLTVEGLDDTIAAYFFDLRQRLRTAGQLLLVVNKALSERSDRDEVELHLRTEIGSIFDHIPHIWTDALAWLDAQPGPQFESDRADSGVAQLASTLTDISRISGAHVRMMKPLRLWSEAAQDAIREISVERGVSQETGEDLVSLDRLLSDLQSQQASRLRDVQDRADDAISELALIHR